MTLFALFLIWSSSRRAHEKKNLQHKSFECGMRSEKTLQSTVSLHFYSIGVLSVLFLMNIVLLYPLALVYKDYVSEGRGLYLFSALVVFLSILTLGLFLQIKSKAIKWK